MGKPGRGGHQQSLRRLVDLTGVISLAERNDLTTLVSAITEKMYNDISGIFDSPPVTPVLSEFGHLHWLSLSLIHRHDHEDKENKTLPAICQSKAATGQSKAYNKAHRIIEKEELEAMTPQLRELKKEALVFFRKWQQNILQRIREINVNDVSASPQSNTRGRGRGVRGQPPRGRGARSTAGVGRGTATTLAIGPPRVPTHDVDRELARRFPPMPNTLWALHGDKRRLLLHIVMLLVLSLQEYNANSRVFLLHLTSSLNLPLETYQSDEIRVSKALAKAALDFPPDGDSDAKTSAAKGPRKWKAALGAGPGHSANFAGPLRAAGVGIVQGGPGLAVSTVAGLLGVMAENTSIMGNLFGISATRPTSKMLEACSREIQDFSFVRLYDATCPKDYCDARQVAAENRRLRLVIAMSGCICDEEDVAKPWRRLGSQAETYTVRWELATLMSLGSALETVIKSTAWESASKEIMSRSIFSNLVESSWPVSLLKISKIIDNPWSVGMVRAEKAGAVLADAIVRHKFQGERPVSLIGYSLASRAIYACLMVLAERRHFGLIDSVVMMGTPAPSESRVWLTLKSVVSGRLVNVYSDKDFILGFLYRTSNIHFGVAGLQEIQGAGGVENYRVKELPRGHLGYRQLTGQVLRDIGWEDLDASVKLELGPRVDQQISKCGRMVEGRMRNRGGRLAA